MANCVVLKLKSKKFKDSLVLYCFTKQQNHITVFSLLRGLQVQSHGFSGWEFTHPFFTTLMCLIDRHRPGLHRERLHLPHQVRHPRPHPDRLHTESRYGSQHTCTHTLHFMFSPPPTPSRRRWRDRLTDTEEVRAHTLFTWPHSSVSCC